MKRILTAAVFAAMALAAPALGPGTIQAESCEGNGRSGRGDNWCRNCPEPPPGCTFYECSKCGCDYSCPIEPEEPNSRIVRLPVRPAGAP